MLAIVEGLLVPLRECLFDEGVHAQSCSFLIASALGAALQVLEEQAQAAVTGTKARTSAALRANLAQQLRVDLAELERELRQYEELRLISTCGGRVDYSLAEALRSIRGKIAAFEASWCEQRD